MAKKKATRCSIHKSDSNGLSWRYPTRNREHAHRLSTRITIYSAAEERSSGYDDARASITFIFKTRSHHCHVRPYASTRVAPCFPANKTRTTQENELRNNVVYVSMEMGMGNKRATFSTSWSVFYRTIGWWKLSTTSRSRRGEPPVLFLLHGLFLEHVRSPESRTKYLQKDIGKCCYF